MHSGTHVSLTVLQLGHAGEGVEIIRLPVAGSSCRMLQLGHAGEGVEITGIGMGSAWVWFVLQLSHAGEGVEMSHLGVRAADRHASIGPRR